MDEDRQVVEYLEDSERRARRPKPIKHKDVFPTEKKSKGKNINSMSDIRKHNYSEEQLTKMKLTELKKVVRDHNLHTTIKGYSTMRKASLVGRVMEFAGKVKSGKSKFALEEEKKWADRAKMGSGSITDQSKLKRLKPPKPPAKKGKQQPKPKKDKLSGILVPGLDKPMYKEGLVRGARNQFARRQRPKRKTRPPDRFRGSS